MYKRIIIFVIFLQITNVPGYSLNFVRSSSNNNENHNPKIIGGGDAPERYAKYMVALVVNNLFKFLVCGGSVVTKRHVLSAAHCIKPFVIWGILEPEFVGVIGSNYWNSSDNIIKFSGYINHPEYDEVTLKNDIGILFTAKDIIFNDRVAPIKLNFNWIGSDVSSFVTGWGLYRDMASIPDRLQLLYVNTVSPLTCIIGVKVTSISWAPPVNPLLEICTFHSRGHGMCIGDSGSALVLQGSREQIGIVSWGVPCALGAPDVFVRLSAFKDFLVSVIGPDLKY